nr:retrovirus-related Pol polyprotein from transposon TNT 1-94 [Tanacetum cinerariifolium]
MVPETPLQFGVVKRLSRTFRAESTWLRSEAPKMLWADSVSTAYFIYYIPYVSIGAWVEFKNHSEPKWELRYEWGGSKKSGSFEDSGRSDEEYSKGRASCKEGGSETPHVRRSTRESRAPVRGFSVSWERRKPSVQVEENYVRIKASTETTAPTWHNSTSLSDSWNEEPDRDVHQVGDEREVEVLRRFNWLPSELLTEDGILPERDYSQFNDTAAGVAIENDNIVAEHGLSSKITQSPSGSSDTSGGSKKSGSFEDSGRSDEEYSKGRASCKEEGSETPHVRRSTRESRAPVRYSLSANYLLITENVVKMTAIMLALGIVVAEDLHLEQLDVKTAFLHDDLDEYICMTQPEGFQSVGKEENLVCKLKKTMYGLKQAPRRCWAQLVRILISEGSLSLLKILETKSLTEMFTRLVMKEKLKFCAGLTGLRVAQSQVNPDSTIGQVEQITSFR